MLQQEFMDKAKQILLEKLSPILARSEGPRDPGLPGVRAEQPDQEGHLAY